MPRLARVSSCWRKSNSVGRFWRAETNLFVGERWVNADQIDVLVVDTGEQVEVVGYKKVAIPRVGSVDDVGSRS